MRMQKAECRRRKERRDSGGPIAWASWRGEAVRWGGKPEMRRPREEHELSS
jgi:hypothetical protein